MGTGCPGKERAPIDLSIVRPATWLVCGSALTGILLRPRGVAEWIWAVAGALVLTVVGLVPPLSALRSVADGADVYFFLIGMMLLAELARAQGIFDWLADHALVAARGSQARLFGLVYGVGVVVTALLSNDATAVVLTPAVAAAVARAGVAPLPYLFVCAFVANAASFILPISNPANLVVFGSRLPRLDAWLAAFALPSLAAVALTLLTTSLIWRRGLQSRFAPPKRTRKLGRSARFTLAAMSGTAVVLMAVAALGRPLGAATFTCGLLATLAIALAERSVPRTLVGVSWSVVPLVAGLFVIVEALDASGALAAARALLRFAASLPARDGALLVAGAVTAAANAINNLPVALAAGLAVRDAATPAVLVHTSLVAVDLGPNLSVTGSLATLLWLIALRREGIAVTPWTFLRIGMLVLTPALVVATLVTR